MFRELTAKLLLCGVIAASSALAGLQTAEAAVARVRFKPPYGTPFPDLEWFGFADVDDGGCTNSGTVSNFGGACKGEFTFLSATVFLADLDDPTVPLQTIEFTGGHVVAVERTSPTPTDWTAIYSSPFNPVQGAIPQTLYDPPGPAGPEHAYFSLIFVGEYAQLYWFKNDPGPALVDPLHFPYVEWPGALYYLGCYLAGPGDHRVLKNRCGLSSNVGGESGRLQFEAAVPEPSSVALTLMALGSLVYFGRRRSRRG